MTDHPAPSSDPHQLARDLEHHGYCIAVNWLDSPSLDDVRLRIDIASQTAPAPDRQADIEDWVIRGGDEWVLLKPVESGLDHLIAHTTALSLARGLLGQRIHLSGFSAHVVHPGNQAMELHTDQWWLPRPVMPGATATRPGDITRAVSHFGRPAAARHPINPAAVINVMWAITDFTTRNGATRLVPGSHLSGAEPDPAVPWPTVDAEVPAGGAVIWDARTWHASGSNTGDEARIGITATYCAHQFRQLQNHTAGITPREYASLGDEMRELLGFRLFSSYGATDSFEAEFARPGFARD